MWTLRNRTPFAAASAFERDRDGREVWAMAVRARFDLGAGGEGLPLCADQPDIVRVPVYGGPEDAILRADTDFVPFLPGTDILLSGTVRPPAPGLDCLPLSLSVGPVTVEADLFGPRVAERGWRRWSLVEAEPVCDTPLDWTMAWGGKGPTRREPGILANPVGMGFGLLAGREAPRGTRVDLPRLVSRGDDLLAASNAARPRGFGPVHRAWEPRLTHAGTYDAAWEQDRAPLLPKDFNELFHHSAPPDLCTPAPLKGGEAVALEGFRAEGPLRFRLPQAVLVARTNLGRDRIESRFRLARVEIDLEAMALGLLWIASVPCNGREEDLDGSQIELRQIAGMRG